MKDYKERVEKIRKDCTDLEKTTVQTKLTKVVCEDSQEQIKEMFLDYILDIFEKEVSKGRILKEILVQDIGEYAEITVRSKNIFECKIEDYPYSAFGVKGLSELYNAITKDEYSDDDDIQHEKVNVVMKHCTLLNGFLNVEYQNLKKIGPINTPGFVFSAHFLRITPNYV